MDKNTRIEILPFQYGVILAQVDNKSDRPLFYQMLTADDAREIASALSATAATVEGAAEELATKIIAKARK